MWSNTPSAYVRVQGGDSITYGFGSTDGNGFRVLVDEEIARTRGVGAIASGSAICSGTLFDRMSGGSGQETDEILTALNVDIPLYHPEIVRINAGTNDSNHRVSGAGTPPTLPQTVANISSMIDAAALVGAKVVLMCPLTPNAVTSYDDALILQDAAILAMVSAHTYVDSVTLVDLRAVTLAIPGWAALRPDATHPGDVEYAALAVAIAEGELSALS